jgi:hypothetical protein
VDELDVGPNMRKHRAWLIFVIPGLFTTLFAAWLYIRPRLDARTHEAGVRGPTISWSGDCLGMRLSILQYDRGAHAESVEQMVTILTTGSGIDSMMDGDSQGIARFRPEGASRTFSAIVIGQHTWTFPLGVDRLLFGLGAILGTAPLAWLWFSNRAAHQEAQQVAAGQPATTPRVGD